MYYWIASTTLALLALTPWTALHAADLWMTDLEAAQHRAAEQDKDLLVLFTGTEWCLNCVKFEQDVLARPDFATAAELFVLVKLEYPAYDDELSEEIRKDYLDWREHYGIQAFPTVILTDASGNPYAGTGNIGLGPKEYVAHLRKLRKVHQRRDEALANAARVEGAEKAKYLDQALTAMVEGLPDEYAAVGGELITRFYRDEIDQILATNAEELSGLRGKYEEILNAKTQRQNMAEVFAEIAKIGREEGAEAAMRSIDERLSGVISRSMRNRLRLSRLGLLRQEKQYEEAIAYAQELADDKSFPLMIRRRAIQQTMADLYLLTGDIDKCAAVYDALIAEVADQPAAAWRFASFKAQRLTAADRLEPALETWENALQYAEPGSSDWGYNELFRARVLMQLERPSDAAAVLEDMLSVEAITPLDQAIALAELAKAQSKAGQRDEARQTIRRTEEFLETQAGQLKESDSEAIRKILEGALDEKEQQAK